MILKMNHFKAFFFTTPKAVEASVLRSIYVIVGGGQLFKYQLFNNVAGIF